jgi:hypothetical protein
MSNETVLLGLVRVLIGARGGSQPGPSELSDPIKPDEVDRHRRLRCCRYDGCLDTACHRGWRSWSCAACSISNESCDPQLDAWHVGGLRPNA